jgi:hypothetical protein
VSHAVRVVPKESLWVCVSTVSLLGNGSENTFPRQRRNFGGVVFIRSVSCQRKVEIISRTYTYLRVWACGRLACKPVLLVFELSHFCTFEIAADMNPIHNSELSFYSSSSPSLLQQSSHDKVLFSIRNAYGVHVNKSSATELKRALFVLVERLGK